MSWSATSRRASPAAPAARTPGRRRPALASAFAADIPVVLQRIAREMHVEIGAVRRPRHDSPGIAGESPAGEDSPAPREA